MADCGRGDLIGSLAREGGLQSAHWAGPVEFKRPVELKHPFVGEIGTSSEPLQPVIDQLS
ncbi:hypothetical protein AWC01_18375 [Mycobacterium doricum]|uniref:Uncharacterized protein n=1 Tax=Mycolicibacterium doricum TaxID=126673 RepID=A0A1X1SX67_9MYCO|nr:hypothetical protein AWC01_18375 [Mycolicibacterium doricum]